MKAQGLTSECRGLHRRSVMRIQGWSTLDLPAGLTNWRDVSGSNPGWNLDGNPSAVVVRSDGETLSWVRNLLTRFRG